MIKVNTTISLGYWHWDSFPNKTASHIKVPRTFDPKSISLFLKNYCSEVSCALCILNVKRNKEEPRVQREWSRLSSWTRHGLHSLLDQLLQSNQYSWLPKLIEVSNLNLLKSLNVFEAMKREVTKDTKKKAKPTVTKRKNYRQVTRRKRHNLGGGELIST